MSKIEVDAIEPQSGTSLTVGASGDTVTVPSGVTFDASNATTTLPSNVVTTTGTQTLTNKTIDASQLTDSTISLAKLSATGTKDATTFLRGDNTFAEAGGTHALVASSTITSNTSLVTLSGMDSTYNTYMVELENIVPSSDNVEMGLRFTQGASIIETDYQWFVARYGIAEGVINVHQHGDTSNIVFAHGVDALNDPSVNGRIFIYNAPKTSMHTSIVATISLQHRDNHDHQLHHSQGEIQNNTASTAVSFRFSAGNIGSGVFKLYGVT
jgi:hypothetical protein